MQEEILQILITFICQFSYESSPSLLFINSSIFFAPEVQFDFPKDSEHVTLNTQLGHWAFSLVLTFSLMTWLWWWWKSFSLTASSTPRPVRYTAPPLSVGPSILPSIQHGPDP